MKGKQVLTTFETPITTFEIIHYTTHFSVHYIKQEELFIARQKHEKISPQTKTCSISTVARALNNRASMSILTKESMQKQTREWLYYKELAPDKMISVPFQIISHDSVETYLETDLRTNQIAPSNYPMLDIASV